MDEVLRSAAHFPDAFIRLPPDSCQVFQYDGAHGLAAFGYLHFRLDGLQHRIDYLAKDIDLKLLICRVSSAHRRRILVTGKPRHDQFRKPTLAADPVKDLDLLWAAGDGA